MCVGCAQSSLATAESIGLEPQTTKLISLAAAAVMLFGLVTPLANPATQVKAGAVCTKANQKVVKSGKTFVCKKSGKKLIWKVQAKKTNQVSTAPNKTTPVPSTGPTTPKVSDEIRATTLQNYFIENKWSTNVTREQLIDSAMYEFGKFAQADKVKSSGADLFYDNSIPAADRVWMTDLTLKSIELFANYHPRKYISIISRDDDWASNQARQVGVQFNSPEYLCGRPVSEWGGGCAGLGWGVWYPIGAYNSKIREGKVDWNTGDISTIPHEFFHSVQTHSDPQRGRIPPNDLRFTPRWFIEGTANFVGGMVVHFYTNFEYGEFRSQQIDQNRDYQGPNGSRPLKDFWNNAAGPDGYLNPYGIGQLAAEYLVANVGMNSMIAILEEAQKLGSFAAGFEKAVGIPLNDFYTKFDQMRSKVGFPAVSP